MILGFDLGAVVWTAVAVVLLFAAVVGILRLIEGNAQRALEALAQCAELRAECKALREDVDDLERTIYGGDPRPGGEEDPSAGFDDFGKSYT